MTKQEKLKAARDTYNVAYGGRYVTYDAYVAYMVAEADYNAAYKKAKELTNDVLQG